jgi:hypothetical protein
MVDIVKRTRPARIEPLSVVGNAAANTCPVFKSAAYVSPARAQHRGRFGSMRVSMQVSHAPQSFLSDFGTADSKEQGPSASRMSLCVLNSIESGLSGIVYLVAPSLVVRTGLDARTTQMNRFVRFLVAAGLGGGSASFAQAGGVSVGVGIGVPARVHVGPLRRPSSTGRR